MARRKRTTPEEHNEIEKGLDTLREWHETGKKLSTKYPVVSAEASKALDEFAKCHKMPPSTARMLKKFADEKQGYSEKDLERLVGLCRKYKRVPGFSIIARLLSVADRGIRDELERLTLEQSWGRGRLDQEIVTRLKRRRQGSGRRPRVSKEIPAILSQLDRYIETWVRWEATAKKLGVLDVGKDSLPRKLRKPLVAVLEQMASLRQALNETRYNTVLSG
jgi:hypothetical protein